MDLVGEMLYEHLRHNGTVTPHRLRPAMKFAGSQPVMPARLVGRFVQYPRLLRRIVSDFDLFHIVDHSYAHLLHHLPHARTVVTCHDLDTFRCVLDPDREKRSFAFRSMARRILTGLESAAHIACASAATRDAILQHGILPAERLSVVHNGVHPLLSPNPDAAADGELARKLGRKPGSCAELLHVGSTIHRKRIDVLLHILAEVRKHHPGVRLIRVGAPFTSQQESLAHSLGVSRSIDVLHRLDTRLLGACYRRASVLLQPSDAEGFGLPVIEALACGARVIASDIPPLRETGGEVTTFCPVADVDSWTRAVLDVLATDESANALHRLRTLEHASRFTWINHAAGMAEIYRRVLAA